MNKNHPILFVGAGPGDPELITVKGQKALNEANVVLYAGSLVPKTLLRWARPDADLVDTASLDLETITGRMVREYAEGHRVVRLHTGDPSFFGAIQEQMNILQREGVPYEVVPGVTAAAAAAAALRQELTLPEITQSVIITRVAGRTPVPERESLDKLAQHGATMSIYLSAHRIESVVEDLVDAYGADAPVVVAYRVSWPDEMIIHGTLSTIAVLVHEAGISRHALIIVGPVLKNSSESSTARSRLYDPGFSHGYRKSESD
jgi:precorrin-4/cobalt-precorrin-4 C11-methyltransferase